MPSIIERNLFMVFSSHQSLLPVTLGGKISRNVVVAIMVSVFFFCETKRVFTVEAPSLH